MTGRCAHFRYAATNAAAITRPNSSALRASLGRRPRSFPHAPTCASVRQPTAPMSPPCFPIVLGGLVTQCAPSRGIQPRVPGTHAVFSEHSPLQARQLSGYVEEHIALRNVPIKSRPRDRGETEARENGAKNFVVSTKRRLLTRARQS